MKPVGLANTRISTDYDQKSPRSLLMTLKLVLFVKGPKLCKLGLTHSHWSERH